MERFFFKSVGAMSRSERMALHLRELVDGLKAGQGIGR